MRIEPLDETVSPLVYGHFSEHLAHIVLDGLWAELLLGRRFETPLFDHGPHPIAAPWSAFAGRTDGVRFARSPSGARRHASPHARGHHVQSIEVTADGAERGLCSAPLVVDGGAGYLFRARLRAIDGARSVRVALRASDGETVLASADLPLDDVVSRVDRLRHHPQLRWMDPTTFREVSCTLSPARGDPEGCLTITLDRPGAVHLDVVSLLPSDHADGWHRGVVDELRALPVRTAKWPGGCFADAYDWRLGIGPRDARYPAMDQAWLGWEENDVGTDEYLRFCELTGSHPVLGVNHGTGTPELAAAWVEYCNGPADSPWGARRAENGHPEPYGVRDWVVGNEVYGFWEVGGLDATSYARRFRTFADAMRAVDPSIRLTASGEVGDCTRELLAEAADVIDVVTVHLYPVSDGGERGPALLDAAATVQTSLDTMRADIDAARPGIKVAVDEWGWSGDDAWGACFNAMVLNAFHRAGDLVAFAHRTCVVNVDGLLVRTGQRVERTRAHDVFALYNRMYRPYAARVHDVPDGMDASALHDGAGTASVFTVDRATLEIEAVEVPCDG